MWTCTHCSEQHDDDFNACWNCGASSDGAMDPRCAQDFVEAAMPVEQFDQRSGEPAQFQLRQIFYVTTMVAVACGIAVSPLGWAFGSALLVLAELIIMLVSVAILFMLFVFAVAFIISCLVYIVAPWKERREREQRLPFDVWVGRQRLMQESPGKDVGP